MDALGTPLADSAMTKVSMSLPAPSVVSELPDQIVQEAPSQIQTISPPAESALLPGVPSLSELGFQGDAALAGTVTGLVAGGLFVGLEVLGGCGPQF